MSFRSIRAADVKVGNIVVFDQGPYRVRSRENPEGQRLEIQINRAGTISLRPASLLVDATVTLCDEEDLCSGCKGRGFVMIMDEPLDCPTCAGLGLRKR